ncbi:MAG: O-antigen ligase family protein [Acholeplasma sp.]|nr:O-antigen ligase family protein [Acholeplasma sp.]
MLIVFILSPISANIIQFYFLLPFQNYLVVNLMGSLIIILQIILIFKLLFSQSVIKKQDLGLILLFAFFQMLTIFFAKSDIISILNFIIVIFSISLIKSNIFVNDNNLKEYSMFAFIIGLVLSIVVALFVLNERYYRFSGLWTNPNIFGLQLLIGISLILYINRSILPVIIKFAFIGLFLYSISLTESRSSIFGLGIVVFLYLAYYLKKIRKQGFNFRSIKFFVFLFVSTASAFLIFNLVLMPIIASRGIVSDGDDISSGRFTHLINNMFIFFSNGKQINFLIGTGIDNSIGFLSKFSPNLGGTHNTYAEMLIASGFLGLTIWIILLFSFILRGSKEFYILPALGVIFFYTFTAHLNASLFIYYLLLFTSLNTNSQNSKSKGMEKFSIFPKSDKNKQYYEKPVFLKKKRY